MANRVTKHVTIQPQHALENVSPDVDVLLDMFSMMVIVLNQNDALPMLNLKRKRILLNALTGEIKLSTDHFCIFNYEVGGMVRWLKKSSKKTCIT